MNQSGYYNYSTERDYPSVGQISRIAQDNSINIIFAVTSNVKGPYANFVPLIKGSSMGVLSGDSSNIVNLVEDQYKV